MMMRILPGCSLFVRIPLMIWHICWTLKDTGNSLTPKSVGYSGLPRYRLRYTVARDPAAALAAGIPERILLNACNKNRLVCVPTRSMGFEHSGSGLFCGGSSIS